MFFLGIDRGELKTNCPPSQEVLSLKTKPKIGTSVIFSPANLALITISNAHSIPVVTKFSAIILFISSESSHPTMEIANIYVEEKLTNGCRYGIPSPSIDIPCGKPQGI